MSASSSANADTGVTKQGGAHKKTVAGSVIVTKYARQIILQETIPHIASIPKLPEHQAAATQHSQDWLDNIWPLIISLTADIIDYANKFQSLYSELGGLTAKLEAGDQKAKSDFLRALDKFLIPALEEKYVTASDVANRTKTFHDNFEPLYNSFDKDFKAANKLITQDNTKILDKQADLLEWKAKAVGYEYTAISAGAAIPFTAAAAIAFSETGVGIIVGGILVGIELAAMATMLGMYADAMHHVHDLTNEISDLNTQVAQLTLIKHQIDGLRTATHEVVQRSAQVRDGWLLLKDDMEKTIKNLTDIDPTDIAIIINSQLDTANKDWGGVLTQAKKLQPDGGQVPSKTFKKSSDMLKAIDDQAAKAKAKGA